MLWQVGLAADMSAVKLSIGRAQRQILAELLMNVIQINIKHALHDLCPDIAILKPKIEWMILENFVDAELSLVTTTLIPTSQKSQKNQIIVDKLISLDTYID
jgi:hypothetical protein